MKKKAEEIMIRNRGGFTLVELIVVSVLGAVVLAAALQVLITNQRTYTVQSATIAGQQSSRMAVEVMFNELRELSPGDGDILMMASDSLRVRLMRRLGVTCAVDLGALTPKITVLDNTGDDFEAGDTVLVFAENREATASDDVWLRALLVAVDTTVTCLGGREAIDLEFNALSTIFTTDTVRVGAPVRGYEIYKYEIGNWMTGNTHTPYLVRRDGGVGPPWPIAGPLRPGNQGLQFTYRDALGAITTTPADVRQIEVMIRTGNRVRTSSGDIVSDSLDTWIHTRN